MKRIETQSGITNKKVILVSWRAERPMITQEKIAREYDQCGARYYETVSGRIFDADIYDRMFNIKPQGPILPQNIKKKPSYRDGKTQLVNIKRNKYRYVK